MKIKRNEKSPAYRHIVGNNHHEEEKNNNHIQINL